MGADLYLQPDFDELYAKLKEANDPDIYDKAYSPEVYFRDSYNNSDVLWRLGLSWWTDVGDLLRGSRMSKAKLKGFIERVEAAPITFELEDDDEARQYFIRKKERLLAFLKRGLLKGKYIYFSI